MGSQSQNLRSCESGTESSHDLPDDQDERTSELDPGILQADASRPPPLPPRLGQHQLQPRFAIQTLEFEDDRPPVPARAPPPRPSQLSAPRRPTIEPRCKTENHGAHSTRRLLSSRSRPGPLGLPSSEVNPPSSGSSRSAQATQKPQLHSRIILERGRPTAVINEGSFEIENVRTLFDQPVAQLSLWPARLPASNLDTIVNMQKCSNEYVEGPTSGPVVTSHVNHELTSFLGSRLNPESVSLDLIGRGEVETVDGEKPNVSPKLERVCKDRIVCSRCGRCRCRKCTERRELPRRWVGKRECGVESAVECCTCMCCARALFYHCVPSEDADFSDDPCAGHDRPRCCARFAALGLLSVCLPCLCFYWPVRGLVRAFTSCYDACVRGGGCRCRCEPPRGAKGLLAESESSSF